MHVTKGKTLAQSISDRTDYGLNPEKTNDGELTSAYACDPRSFAAEVLVSKRQYKHFTGKEEKNDVLVYQVRQSFKPGEVTPEEANQIGYDFASRFLKGKHAFFVCTHTDKSHIHNHIYWNAVTLDCKKKFRDFRRSHRAVSRLSDLICTEHQLSVIDKPQRGSTAYNKWHGFIVILLGTGLRVSELYGLTKADIDFDRRCIHIKKQLCRTADKPYFIAPPKTKSGIRSIPMTDSVYMAFRRVIENRGSPKVEMMVDGYSGFLFLDKDDRPKVAMHLENYMRLMQRKYVKLYGNTLPTVSPHVLRHTFCTNAQQAMLDVKSLQYIMGHSTASVTLDVYTHSDFESAERAFHRISKAL